VYEPSGVLYCSDVSELAPHIRAIVEPQGIKSMLHCAILDRGVFRGYVGFDECSANYLWTQGQISLLQFMAEVLAVFLIKQRSSDGNKKN
jgi:GAF domain-containing protein